MKKLSILLFALIFVGVNINAQENKAETKVKEEVTEVDPASLAQAQLEAYNAKDIDAFLESYADDVKVYNFPDQLTMEGKEAMRPIYTRMFANVEDLHCEVINRMVLGNKVIDHEKITGFVKDDYFYAIAIYTIEANKIAEVRFLKP